MRFFLRFDADVHFAGGANVNECFMLTRSPLHVVCVYIRFFCFLIVELLNFEIELFVFVVVLLFCVLCVVCCVFFFCGCVSCHYRFIRASSSLLQRALVLVALARAALWRLILFSWSLRRCRPTYV